MKLPVLIVASALFGATACSHLPHTHGNHRPMITWKPASEFVRQCTFAVRFNEDEATVHETDYMDAMYCMGVMDGLQSANYVIAQSSPDKALFCLPDGGVKTWILAKAVVDFARDRPDFLQKSQAELSMAALGNKFPCARY